MRILSFDPGHTTGVCVLETTLGNTDFEVLSVDEIPWQFRFGLVEAFIHGTLPIQPQPHPPEFVIVERFRLRAGKEQSQIGSEFPSSQISGIIEHVFWDFTGTLPESSDYFIYQEPVSMSRVQILDRHVPLVEGSEHKKDAYKHARFFFTTKVRLPSVSVQTDAHSGVVVDPSNVSNDG